MLRGFSWKQGISDFTTVVARYRASGLNKKADLPALSPYTLEPGQPSPGSPSLLRPPFAVTPSTGILTCFPSTTLFSLALGVDSPCPD